MRESEVEKILVCGIRKLGGWAYKWVSPGNDGVPDRIVILPGQRPIFVELKAERGGLTALQKVQIDRLRMMRQDARVLYGEKEVRGFLAECEERLKDGI